MVVLRHYWNASMLALIQSDSGVSVKVQRQDPRIRWRPTAVVSAGDISLPAVNTPGVWLHYHPLGNQHNHLSLKCMLFYMLLVVD